MACIEVKVGGTQGQKEQASTWSYGTVRSRVQSEDKEKQHAEMPVDSWHSDAGRQNRWLPVLACGPWKWEEGELLGGG